MRAGKLYLGPLGHRNPKFRLDLLAFEGIQSQMTFVTQAINLFLSTQMQTRPINFDLLLNFL